MFIAVNQYKNQTWHFATSQHLPAAQLNVAVNLHVVELQQVLLHSCANARAVLGLT